MKTRFLSILLLLSALVTVLGLTACGGGGSSSSESTSGSTSQEASSSEGGSETVASSSEPIKIGAVVANTGVMSQYDVPAMATVKFAVQDINKEGGIDGREVQLIERDYKSERSLAPTVAKEVIDEGAEVMITSCDFDYGSPAALIAQNDGIASFSLCAGSPRYGPKGGLPLGFSAGVVSQASAAATAEWAYQKMNWHSTFQLVDPTLAVDIDWSNGFKERWKELGGELAGSSTFQNEDQSISSQISEIEKVESKIDFINVVSYPPGGAAALKQIRAAGIKLPIVVNDAMDGTEWIEGIPNLSEVYVVDHDAFFGDDPSAEVNELTKRYEKAEGKAPPSSLFIDGYIAMQMIQQGIEKAGGSTEGEAITKGLTSGSKVETVVGPTTFSSEIHTSMNRPLTITKIEDGKPGFFARITAKKVPPIKIE